MGRLRADFSDDVVVVTGGASGIGRAVALRFGEADATVIVADLAEEPKDADVPTHEVIEESGGDAVFVETDVTERAEVESVVEAAREFGGVDVMVNNAGFPVGGSILELDDEDFAHTIDVNVKGVFLGTQVAARDMVEREDPGVILNTASISSTLAQYDQVGYDATKGAVRMLTRGSALDLAEHGVRVNAVAPGQIATEFFEGWTEMALEQAEEDEFIKPVPLGRAGIPDDLPGAYLYLASEDASYVTGEFVHVDGGWQVF